MNLHILVIGDFHIPRRASKIPDEILEFIERESFDLVLCTGDLVRLQILEKLKRLGPTKIVIGNMDPSYSHPEDEVMEAEGWKIGLTHGHYIFPRGDTHQLLDEARRLVVEILISGHTHADSIHHQDGILLLNPGSAVGAWSFVASGIPSFMVLILTPDLLTVELYKLVKRELTKITSNYEKSQFH